MSIDDTPSTLIAPATILQDRYRVVRQLGRGGMGAVYEAIDLRLGHTVALKQSLSNDVHVLKQFHREARLLAHLNHPVLPRVSDYFTDAGRAFLVMQFVAGDDLASLLAQQQGPLPPQTVVAWADQLLDAIIYLHTHDRQIIHRDIKPHNLKVTPSGKIALLDFGLAKAQRRSEDETSGHSISGYSPRYAPLEQIHDTGTGPQNDIYALGATLYHLLTGNKPVDAITRATAIVNSQPSPLSAAHELNPAVGLELSRIIGRAMAPDPNERYATATEFREALRRLGRVDELAPMTDEEDEYGQVYLPPQSSRFRFRALATTLIILLASFAVFCRYYQWRMPDNNGTLPPYLGSVNQVVRDGARTEAAKVNDQSERHLRPKKRRSR